MRVLAALFNFSSQLTASALSRKATHDIAITPHVLPLTVTSYRHPTTPSSAYLHKRRNSIHPTNTSSQDDPDGVASSQRDLFTVGGNIYMTSVTIGDNSYMLVIDTGSSDTWVASTNMQCLSRLSYALLPQAACRFSALFNASKSRTYREEVKDGFQVSYMDGEWLMGDLGSEVLHVGNLQVRQTMGLVEEGSWYGDGVSSGLMGLAYSSLASGVADEGLNYTSIIFSLFNTHHIPPVFSLALSRPTLANPIAGGLLAIGGIPDIAHDDNWARTPIIPQYQGVFTFYTIMVDGFVVVPPASSAAARSAKRRVVVVAGNSTTVENNELSTQSSIAGASKMALQVTVDSGATDMYVPVALADFIADSFSPPATFNKYEGVYTVPCRAAAPSVAVIIDGVSFYVDPRDLVSRQFGGDGAMEKRNGTEKEEKNPRAVCTLSLQIQQGSDTVLGDSWLKNVVVVFDVGESEMRFAAREKY